MSDPTLAVERLRKRYAIGALQQRPAGSLREAVAAGWRRMTEWRKSEGARDYIWALDDVSFTARAGEVVGIVGRNGAGKSTLLKVLSRITRPTSGWAEIRGRLGSLLEIGTGFHPELTGRDNIYLNGALLGMRRTEIHRQFDAIVDFSGVERFLDTPVKRCLLYTSDAADE